MSALLWAGIAALGAGGALLRFLVDGIVTRRVERDFPFGTLIVNVSGALVFGLLVGLGFSGSRLLLAGTATIGSYTTFSTWMFETQRLVEDGEFGGAAGIGCCSSGATSRWSRSWWTPRLGSRSRSGSSTS